MKSIIITLCLLSISFVYSQENAKESFYSKGSKSLLFSFSGLDNLNANTFNGGIGGKYYLSDKFALRFGLQFDYFSETTPANPDTDEVGLDGESSSLDFGLSAAFEWHITSGRVSPYLGGGLGYSTSSTEEFNPMRWANNFTGSVVKTTYETSGINSFEFFGIGGVEFFIAKGVSLAAEYHIRYRHASSGEAKTTWSLVQGTDSRYPISETYKGPSSNTFGFTTGGALTLAIYF